MNLKMYPNRQLNWQGCVIILINSKQNTHKLLTDTDCIKMDNDDDFYFWNWLNGSKTKKGHYFIYNIFVYYRNECNCCGNMHNVSKIAMIDVAIWIWIGSNIYFVKL